MLKNPFKEMQKKGERRETTIAYQGILVSGKKERPTGKKAQKARVGALRGSL